jgi:hypothetical protein
MVAGTGGEGLRAKILMCRSLSPPPVNPTPPPLPFAEVPFRHGGGGEILAI